VQSDESTVLLLLRYVRRFINASDRLFVCFLPSLQAKYRAYLDLNMAGVSLLLG